MTADERTHVLAVLNAALKRDPEERAAFLDEACAGRRYALVASRGAQGVASFVIEPNTTRSAFRGRSSAVRTPAASRRTPSS